MASQSLFDSLSNNTQEPTKEGKDKMKRNTRKFRLMLTALTLAAASLVLAASVAADPFTLNGIAFNDDYIADRGYVAYIQPYDAENQFHSLPGQAIEQYGDPGDAPLGPWIQGQWFDFEYGKPFGGGETKSWGGQNYVVTYWWDTCVGDYVPVNGPGSDIYIYQPDEGKRPMGILYQGQWHMFDAGTNGLSDVGGEDFWWDLSDAGVAEDDTIEALAWWSNALGWPGLMIEKKFLSDGHREQYPGPSALDMDGDGSTEPLIFHGGGTSMSWHDDFYMGVGNAIQIPPPTEVWVDDGYCDGCANDGHTWCYDAFDNIQDGIDAVENSIVHVGPGTYNENIMIPSDKDGLQLLGAGKTNTHISIASGSAIETHAPATIKGFHIQGPARGTGTAVQIRADGSGCPSSASGTAANPGVIEDNKADNLNYGVQLHDHCNEYWEIKNNEFDELRIGVGLQNSRHFVVSGNAFDDYKEGVSAGWDDDTAHHVTITNNQFLGSFHGQYKGGPDELAAIVLSSSTHDYTIAGNDITDSIVGVLVRNPGSNAPDLTNVTVYCNNISGNTDGIVNEHTGLTLMAENNWWGAADGPSGTGSGSGDPVSANVDFDPWMTTPVDGVCPPPPAPDHFLFYKVKTTGFVPPPP